MTLSTSAVAGCRRSDSLRSSVRARTSSDNRTFSIAMNAGSAKDLTSSISFPAEGPTHRQTARGKRDLRPLQVTQLQRPQAVPVAEQYHGRVAMAPAAELARRGPQPLDLGGRQILARSN